MRSIKKIEERLEQIKIETAALKEEAEKLTNRKIKLLSRQKFKFPDIIAPYSEIILVKNYYRNRGLGYEDDYDEFSGYTFTHPNSKYAVRFSEKSLDKYGIPYNEVARYGDLRKEQDEFPSQIFTGKFHSIVKKYKGYTQSVFHRDPLLDAYY